MHTPVTLWGYSAKQLDYAGRCRDGLLSAFEFARVKRPDLSDVLDRVLTVRYSGWWIGLALEYFGKRTVNIRLDEVTALLESWDIPVRSRCEHCGRDWPILKTDPVNWNPAHDNWLAREEACIQDAKDTGRYQELAA